MNNYKVTAIENFTYTDFDKVIFIEKEKYNYHWIYKGDVFLCNKDRYEYLSGNNKKKLVVVELDGILVEEEKKDTEKEEVASKKKTTRKRATKKTSKE